jgi:hypothetical protein
MVGVIPICILCGMYRTHFRLQYLADPQIGNIKPHIFDLSVDALYSNADRSVDAQNRIWYVWLRGTYRDTRRPVNAEIGRRVSG